MNIKRQFSNLFLVLAFFVTGACRAKGDDSTISWQPDGTKISEENIQWGAPKNHLKAGLSVQYNSDVTNRTLVGFWVVLYNDSATNGNYRPDLLTLTFPRTNISYTLSLFDSNRVAVAKTDLLKDLERAAAVNSRATNTPARGQAIRNPADAYGVWEVTPLTVNVMPFDPIILQRYFVIRNKGKYELEFVLHASTYSAGKRHAIDLPVNANITIDRP